MLTDPDSYIPQQIAIGPYHHLRPELYDMETHKVAAAKKNHMEFGISGKFQDLVDQLKEFDGRIRANYHRPLSFGREALSWMMAVDASFLFEFLQVCGVKQGKFFTENQSRLAHLYELSKNTTAHNTILKDIIMLENQIPLFIMEKLLKFHFSSQDVVDEVMLDLLFVLNKELSPFSMVEHSRKVAVDDCAHLLDFLYKMIVPKKDRVHQVPSRVLDIHLPEGEDHHKHPVEIKDSFEKPSCLHQLADALRKVFFFLKEGIKKIIGSKPVQFVVKFLSKIPVVSVLKEPIEHMFSVLNDDEEKKDDEESSENSNKLPLQEEIAIPSVTQLIEVGVQFVPTNEGISSIKFDKKTLKFYLPKIELDANSAVVLRNMVAYEACTGSGQLLLARYTELMDGIIDTDADAKFLCQKEVIINHLKSEQEVADLWNGMCKSIRLAKVPSLDKVIADVNKYYNKRWKVKFEKFMKEYVFGSWRILTFLAAITVLLLMFLQAFCQIYSCSRILPIKGLEPAVTA